MSRNHLSSLLRPEIAAFIYRDGAGAGGPTSAAARATKTDDLHHGVTIDDLEDADDDGAGRHGRLYVAEGCAADIRSALLRCASSALRRLDLSGWRSGGCDAFFLDRLFRQIEVNDRLCHTGASSNPTVEGRSQPNAGRAHALRSLALAGNSVSGNALNVMTASCTGLRHLKVTDGGFRFDSVAPVTRCLAELRSLNVSGCGFLRSLIPADTLLIPSSLRVVIATDCKSLSGLGVKPLRDAPNLEELHLGGCTAFASFEVFSEGFARLRKLVASSVGLNRDGRALTGVSALPALEELDLADNRNLSSLLPLTRCRRLATLRVNGCHALDIVQVAMDTLHKVATLTELDASGCAFPARPGAAAALAPAFGSWPASFSRRLRWLRLTGCGVRCLSELLTGGVSDFALQLPQPPSMDRLSNDVASSPAAGFPQRDGSVCALPSSRLTELDVSYCRYLTDLGVALASDHCGHLRHINASYMRGATVDTRTLESLASLPFLETLDVSREPENSGIVLPFSSREESQRPEEPVLCLAPLGSASISLRRLVASGHALSAASIVALFRHPTLAELDVSKCFLGRVPNGDIARLFLETSRLVKVNLSSCGLADSHFEPLLAEWTHRHKPWSEPLVVPRSQVGTAGIGEGPPPGGHTPGSSLSYSLEEVDLSENPGLSSVTSFSIFPRLRRLRVSAQNRRAIVDALPTADLDLQLASSWLRGGVIDFASDAASRSADALPLRSRPMWLD